MRSLYSQSERDQSRDGLFSDEFIHDELRFIRLCKFEWSFHFVPLLSFYFEGTLLTKYSVTK